MKFTINFLEKKSPEWIVANLLDESGTEIKEVSINKTSKKGDLFPHFDELMSGGTVEGEPWISGAGKNYLFPPKVKLEKPEFMKAKTQQIEKTMARKEESIGRFQDNKEIIIKISSTMRDATLLAVAEMQHTSPSSHSDIELLVLKWRKWLWDNYDMTTERDLPF